MLKMIARAGVTWTGGLGRYVDLAAAWCLIVMAAGLGSPLLLGLGALSMFTFAIDLGGIVNRFVLRRIAGHTGGEA